MKKKYLICFVAILLISAAGCGKSDSEVADHESDITQSEQEENREEQHMDEPLITREYLIEHCKINEEDLEGIDVDAFIKEFDLKESNIGKVNLEFLLEIFKEEGVSEAPLYEYLTKSSYESGGITKENIKEVRKAALYIVDGTYQETLILDGETETGYWGKAVNLFVNIDDVSEQISYTDKKEQEFKELLENCRLDTWKEKYEGSSENTTGSFGWTLYLELADGRIYRYSGNGVMGNSTPENWDEFEEGFKNLFEE